MSAAKRKRKARNQKRQVRHQKRIQRVCRDLYDPGKVVVVQSAVLPGQIYVFRDTKEAIAYGLTALAMKIEACGEGS